MSDKELLAAAERLSNASDNQYWDGNRSPFSPEQDGALLARHVREILDETPIDEPWLESIGFERWQDPVSPLVWRRVHNRFPYVVEWRLRGPEIHALGFPMPWIKTRGALRRLLALLETDGEA